MIIISKEHMQIFEFHFNPKKKNRVVNSYCYEPEELNAKKSGYLYMAGELLNILPGSEQFLNNLSKIIKEEYYSKFYFSFNESIRKGLIRANDYLSSQISRNNVSWLGNLNFAIVSLYDKNIISATKIGNVKILMIKNEKIIDITKNTNSLNRPSQESSYSPKVFGRIFSGKINRSDKIIILTQEVFDLFQKLSVLEEISSISHINKEVLEKIIDSHKNELLKISGALLIIETLEEKKQEKENLNQYQELNFSFKNVFSSFFKRRLNYFLIKKIKKGKPKKNKNLLLNLKNKITIKKLNFLPNQNSKKTIFLILFLIFLLFLGSFIFKNEKKSSDSKINETIIVQEIEKAEKLISENQEQEAFEILEAIYNQIKLNKDFSEIKNKIEFHLAKLSNLEIIESPELVYEFNIRDLAPQRIAVFERKLYFFTPFSNKIIEFDIDTRESIEYFLPVEKSKGPSSVKTISNNLIFFVKPNNIFSLKNNEIRVLNPLKEPTLNYNLSYFSVFWTSLYFWDSENKEIIRYTSYDSLPEKWLSSDTKKPTDTQSMSVDGSIWILDENNSVLKYSSGKLSQEIILNIFPFFEKPSHIFTSPSLYHLFILEPLKNRIIIIDKQGNIIKQFQSEEFNNLVHFSISENGDKIYLLNNLQVYEINLR